MQPHAGADKYGRAQRDNRRPSHLVAMIKNIFGSDICSRAAAYCARHLQVGSAETVQRHDHLRECLRRRLAWRRTWP